MKKFLSIILTLAMVFAMSASAFAASADFDPTNQSLTDGYIINQNGTISSTTVDDIKSLVHERNWAILAGDTSRENQFQQALENAGAYKSTTTELAAFSDNAAIALGSPNVTYDTIQYSVVVSGKTYQVKEIIAHPTVDSNLFHSDSINKKSISSSVSAGSYELLKVMGSLAVGAAYEAVGIGISAYDALKSVIFGFAPTTTVYGITANYSCAALEQVSFYQVLLNGYWTPFASSSYVQTGFGSIIFDTDYSGGTETGLNMEISGTKDVLYSTYSLNSSGDGYNTANILARYFTSYLFDKKSQVKSATFYHDADGTVKTIRTFGMLCPTTTADIT